MSVEIVSGKKPWAQRRFGRLERERAGAVPNVEQDASLDSVTCRVADSSAFVDDLHRLTREAMGDNVATAQQVKDAIDLRRRRSYVDHHGKFAFLTGLNCDTQRVDSGIANRRATNPYFSPQLRGRG